MTSRTALRRMRCIFVSRMHWPSSMSWESSEHTSSVCRGGGRLGFGIGEHAPERVSSLVVIGQQPYRISPDGPLTRVVGAALAASRTEGIGALVRAFEAIAGRYPDPERMVYLANDAAAMRAAWGAVMAEGAVSKDLRAWRLRCLIAVASRDVDFHDQAQRAANEIPDGTFISLEGLDHLGMDTAEVDPLLPAVLKIIREGSLGRSTRKRYA